MYKIHHPTQVDILKTLFKSKAIRNFSRSGKIFPEFGLENIRELIEGNFRIVYRVITEVIYIVRAQYSAMLLRDI